MMTICILGFSTLGWLSRIRYHNHNERRPSIKLWKMKPNSDLIHNLLTKDKLKTIIIYIQVLIVIEFRTQKLNIVEVQKNKKMMKIMD
jgi:hypothetical protein